MQTNCNYAHAMWLHEVPQRLHLPLMPTLLQSVLIEGLLRRALGVSSAGLRPVRGE
jgi:hypothetical protein